MCEYFWKNMLAAWIFILLVASVIGAIAGACYLCIHFEVIGIIIVIILSTIIYSLICAYSEYKKIKNLEQCDAVDKIENICNYVHYLAFSYFSSENDFKCFYAHLEDATAELEKYKAKWGDDEIYRNYAKDLVNSEKQIRANLEKKEQEKE